MKRFIGTEEDRKRVLQLLKREKVGWRRERLVALKMGFSGENTLYKISLATGRSVPTIQRWFSKYRKGGVEAVLKRNFKGKQYQHFNERVEAFLKIGLKNGRWNTVVQAKESLQKEFGKSFKYTTVRTWLKKITWGDARSSARG